MMALVNDLVSHDAKTIPNTLLLLGIDQSEFNLKRSSFLYKIGLFFKSYANAYEVSKHIQFDLNLTAERIKQLSVESYEFTYEEINFAYQLRLNEDLDIKHNFSKLSLFDLKVEDILTELQNRLVDSTLTLADAHNWWEEKTQEYKNSISQDVYSKHNKSKHVEQSFLFLNYDIAELNYMKNLAYNRERQVVLNTAKVQELYMLCAYYYEVDMKVKNNNQPIYTKL